MKKIIVITTSFLLLSIPATGQMLSLDQCIELALKNKETVKSAALDVKSAKYGKRGSLSNILPSFGAGAGYSSSTFQERVKLNQDSTYTFYNSSSSNSWGLQLSQNIYDGGAWWNMIADAKNNYIISQQLERQVKINVVYYVIEAYYSLLKSQQLLDVARMNLMLANQQVELVTNQFEIGAAAKTDLLKVNVLRGQAQVEVITSDAEFQNAVRVLRNTMGLMGNIDPLMVDEASSTEYTIPELVTALTDMENNNPSILAKKAQIRGAELNHKIVRGSRLPSVDLGWNYRFQGADATGLLGDDDWSSTFSLNFSVPLFTGFDLHTKTQQAKLNISKEENEFITQMYDLRVQLEVLLEILRNYQETIPINEEVLTSAEEDLKLVQERYALGSVTILEVLDAQLSVTQARSSLVSAKYNAQIQAAALLALTGVLDSQY